MTSHSFHVKQLYCILPSHMDVYKKTRTAVRLILYKNPVIWVRIVIRKIRLLFGIGSLPDFLVIGTARGGSTSLYDILSRHPDVIPARKKELRFLSLSYGRGLLWYRSNFPILKRLRRKITGEASPDYLEHPLSPKRAFEILPDVKIVVLLRNPIDRAFSHYHWVRNKGDESLDFGDAVENEDKRLASEMDIVMRGGYSWEHQRHAYLREGRYAEQLERWFHYYDRERMLIIKSEDYFADPQAECEKVFRFLGIGEFDTRQITNVKKNSGRYETESMNPKVRMKLVRYFEPFNERLYSLLDRDFGWY